MALRIVPITLKAANNFVQTHHRHSGRTNNDGGKYAIGLECDAQLVGVAIVGRPTARMLQHGGQEFPAELLRLCTSSDCPKGGSSKLYSRAKRIWQLMGGSHFHTYTLQREGGGSMRGAGLIAPIATVRAEKWDRPSRRRVSRALEGEPKHRWTEELSRVPA